MLLFHDLVSFITFISTLDSSYFGPMLALDYGYSFGAQYENLRQQYYRKMNHLQLLLNFIQSTCYLLLGKTQELI